MLQDNNGIGCALSILAPDFLNGYKIMILLLLGRTVRMQDKINSGICTNSLLAELLECETKQIVVFVPILFALSSNLTTVCITLGKFELTKVSQNEVPVTYWADTVYVRNYYRDRTSRVVSTTGKKLGGISVIFMF